MRYALIGCGRIGKNHLRAALENGLEIAAVCDILPQRMEQLLCELDLQEQSSIARYVDYQEMIDKEQLQLVAVATPSGSHGELALHCIEQGIHVLIEKPIALEMVQAREIIRLAQEKQVKVSVCHQNRFNLPVQKLRKAVEAGKLGKLSHGTIHVRWHRDKDYYRQAAWRGTWAEDGGTLMNQCIHGIDMLCWMMNQPAVMVYGVTRQRFHPYLEGEDLGLAVVQFADGSAATIEGTANVYPENLEESLCLFGETGTVKLGGKSLNKVEVWKLKGEREEESRRNLLEEQVENIYGNGHIALYHDMIEAIEKNREPFITAQDGANALEVVLAIYKSQKEGKPVSLPLENFSTLDMIGEFPHE